MHFVCNFYAENHNLSTKQEKQKIKKKKLCTSATNKQTKKYSYMAFDFHKFLLN